MVEPNPSARGRPFRVGLLVPSSNTVLENDVHRGLPVDTCTVHTARMYLVATTREAELQMITDHAPKAAADLGTADLDLLVFGCTSAGSLFGLDYDARTCAELGRIAGCPAMGTISAVSDALDRRRFRRVAVITPYVDDLTSAVAAAVVTPDRSVVAAHGMGIDVNVQLADPSPEDVVAFAASKLEGADFDGIFVSCTNFRALEAVPMLEARFGVPVMTSNRAVIEGILTRRDAGCRPAAIAAE